MKNVRQRGYSFLRGFEHLDLGNFGPNIFFIPVSSGEDDEFPALVRGSSHVSERLGFMDEFSNGGLDAEPSSVVIPALCREAESFDSRIAYGFQLVATAGPLCEESMWGLAFVIEARISPLERQESVELETSYQSPEQHGIFTGQVVNTVKDACRTRCYNEKTPIDTSDSESAESKLSSFADYWDSFESEIGVDESSMSPQGHWDTYMLGHSLSHDQLFSIIDFSPNWAYAGSEVKVLIMGKFLKGQQGTRSDFFSLSHF